MSKKNRDIRMERFNNVQADLLYGYRKDRGYTAKEVAWGIGKSPTYVYNRESTITKTSLWDVMVLLEFYKVGIEDFMTDLKIECQRKGIGGIPYERF